MSDFDYGPDTGGGGSKVAIAIGAFFLVVVVAGGLFMFVGRNPPKVDAPTAFVAYTAPDKSFSCQQPEGWDVSDAAGGAVVASAAFMQGGAKIDITSDLSGSLMADINKSFGQMGGGMMDAFPGAGGGEVQKTPVEKAHDRIGASLAEKFSDFEDGPTLTFTSKVGQARYSEFSAKAGRFGGRMKGIRATMLGGERQIRVLATCPERDWESLKPAFEKVIGSIVAGAG